MTFLIIGKIQTIGKVGKVWDANGSIWLIYEVSKVGKAEVWFSHNGQDSGSRQSWQSWGQLYINIASLLSKQSLAKLRYDFSQFGQNSDSRQSWQSWGNPWINMASLLNWQSWQSWDMHCCMKCPQILREKTLSEKYTEISL